MDVTTFGQMDNIRSFGYYTVGVDSDVVVDNVCDAIELTLKPPTEQKLLKTSYSPDELRDLKIRIVLIAGSKAQKKDVDHFLDVRM